MKRGDLGGGNVNGVGARCVEGVEDDVEGVIGGTCDPPVKGDCPL